MGKFLFAILAIVCFAAAEANPYYYYGPRYRSGAVTQDVVSKQEATIGTPNNVVSVAPVDNDDEDSDEALDDDVEDDEDLPAFDELFPNMGKPSSGGNPFGVVRNQLSTRAWAKTPPRYVRNNYQRLRYNRFRSGYYRADEEEEDEEDQQDDDGDDDESFIPDWNEMFPKLPESTTQQGQQQQQVFRDRPVRRRPSLLSSLVPRRPLRPMGGPVPSRPAGRPVQGPTPVQRYRYDSDEDESSEVPQYRHQMPMRNVVRRQQVSYRPMTYYNRYPTNQVYTPMSYGQPVYVQRPMMNYNRRQYNVVGGRRVVQTQRRPVVYNYIQYGNRRRPMMRRQRFSYYDY